MKPFKAPKQPRSLFEKNKKYNPFEVHINKSKFNVLGQVCKDDRGLPGVSRSKGIKKRERTLLQEYKNRYKSNKIIDQRIGEHNPFMDPEQKMALRMVAGKKELFSKKSKFNLNDEADPLTHGGEVLTGSNAVDYRAFSDDDDDNDLLDSNFVKQHHFGGDFLTKSSESNKNEDDRPVHKSRQDKIDEIIADSKMKKAESRLLKEAQNDTVSALDEQFRTFASLMAPNKMTDAEKMDCTKTCQFQNYDRLANQIDYCKRAVPADRLKSDEEIAKEEREKLIALEAERKKRMLGEIHHCDRYQPSADALDDGLSYVKDPELYVSYEDGALIGANLGLKEEQKPIKGQNKSLGSSQKEKTDKSVDEEDDDESAEEEDDESGEDDDDESGEEEDDESGEEDDDESGDKEDNYSDVLEDKETINEDEEKSENGESAANSSILEDDEESNKTEENSEYGNTCSERSSPVVSGVRNTEMKFTYEVPNDYETFWNLLQGHIVSEVSTIIQRMITCNNPKTATVFEGKKKCAIIFSYLLQTLHTVCSPESECILEGQSNLSFVDILVPHMYTITQLVPAECASALAQVLDEKYEDYKRNSPRKYPMLDTFIFLKVAGIFFPSSDYHHEVMTRVVAQLTFMLGEAKVTTSRDVSCLLFASSLLHEYLSSSGRFVGELTNALRGILYLSIPSDNSKLKLLHTAPFKKIGPASDILVLKKKKKKKVSKLDTSKFKLSSLNTETEITEAFKVSAFHNSLVTTKQLISTWTNLSSARVLFSLILPLLEKVQTENYPQETLALIEDIKNCIGNLPKQGRPLFKAHSVKTLKLLEPKIEENFSGCKKRKAGKDSLEVQMLRQKLKRERKGVNRELKKDTAFMAKVKLQETLLSDAQRKRKVNIIMQDLGSQENEFKKFLMTKKKKY